MRINLTARHFKPPKSLREFAEKKITKLEKYYNGILDCEILVTAEKMDRIVELSMKVSGQQLRVVEKSEDVFKSMEIGIDKLERQLKKYKEKLRDHHHDKRTFVDELSNSDE